MGILLRQREYPKARALIVRAGRASFYDTGAALSPVPAGLLAAPFAGLFGLAGAGQMRRPQIRAARAGEPLGLGATPGRDLGMVAAGEDGRDRAALPELRPGILRVFEQAVAEALLRARGLLAHDAGEEPHAGVEQDEGRNLPTRKHVIADRNLLEATPLDQALIDALEATAEDDGAGPIGQRCDAALGERNSARAHHQARARIACGRYRIDSAGEHVGTHHHAGSAAGGRVVDGAVLVGRVRADVDGFERPQAGRERLTREAYAERPRKHLGEDGENGRAPHDAEQIPPSYMR